MVGWSADWFWAMTLLDLAVKRDFRNPSVTGLMGDGRDGFQKIGRRAGLCAAHPSFGPWQQGRFPGQGSLCGVDCAIVVEDTCRLLWNSRTDWRCNLWP
jgi:hypothetical protein